MQKGKKPYINLGTELYKLRNSSNESLVEVSGSVEIEVDLLASYENGELRPSEDILQLIINHFELEDEEADRLWGIAGYNKETESVTQGNGESNVALQPAVMLLPIDARIIYTDTVNVTVNNYGVVLNFLQNAGPNGTPIPISRVGMSLDHAKSVIEVMQKTIEMAAQSGAPKLLSSPKNSVKKRRK